MLNNRELREIEKVYGVKIKRKGGNFSKYVVVSVILLNVIFTLAVFYSFLKIGSEPMTLIGAWFGFTTIELWSLSKIKREEVKVEEETDYEN